MEKGNSSNPTEVGRKCDYCEACTADTTLSIRDVSREGEQVILLYVCSQCKQFMEERKQGGYFEVRLPSRRIGRVSKVQGLLNRIRINLKARDYDKA